MDIIDLRLDFEEDKLSNEGLTKNEYIAYIFGFDFYETGPILDKWIRVAIDVSVALTELKTFDYIKRSDLHREQYLIMAQMPFFSSKMEWGTSIRGAWWVHSDIEVLLFGKIKTFSRKDWDRFIYDLRDFYHE